jgi:hypothetical protein
MYWKTTIMTVVMSLIFAGAALATGGGQATGDQQQERAGQQDGLLGIGDDPGMEQTFTGTLDRIEDDYILIVEDRAYMLEVEDEQMVEGMIGQEVEVRGTLDEETIEAQTVNPAGELGEQPGAGQRW